MPEEPASALEAQVEGVYELAGPAVVNITSRSYAYDFFMRPIPQEGSGSGFVYDTEGHIVTNTAINGEPVTDSQELTVYLETQTQVGDTVEVTILRDGEERDVQVTLAERPR